MVQRYIRSFEVLTLLLGKAVTLLRSKDVIHRGPVSFRRIKHVPVLVFIPVQRKRNEFFLKFVIVLYFIDTPLEKNITQSSKMKKKILFTIFKL